MRHIPLGPGTEFDQVRAIARALGDTAAPLGDDCAIVGEPRTGSLVLSTDVSVEGVHFRREWLTLEEIGWRAAAAALSDLAAEGASVTGVLAAIVAPFDASGDDFTESMRGVGAVTELAGGRVLGGDLSRGPGWALAITVVGYAVRPVTRSGGRPGDSVWVTGELGGARAALSTWLTGGAPAREARHAFAHPEPRIREGLWLAAHGACAMIDVSDGLGADAAHLAAAGGVRLELRADAVPCGAGTTPAEAVQGGEDFELLVVLPPAFGAADARAFARDCGTPISRIGTVAEGSGVSLTLGGVEIVVRGFDHFR